MLSPPPVPAPSRWLAPAAYRLASRPGWGPAMRVGWGALPPGHVHLVVRPRFPVCPSRPMTDPLSQGGGPQHSQWGEYIISLFTVSDLRCILSIKMTA